MLFVELTPKLVSNKKKISILSINLNKKNLYQRKKKRIIRFVQVREVMIKLATNKTDDIS